jgi:hypothetical protein
MECLTPSELQQFLSMIDVAVTFIGKHMVIVHATAGDAVWTFSDGLFCPNQGAKS